MFCRSLVRLNNWITKLRRVRVPAANVLLLVPHCLQRTGCAQNVIQGIDACRRCGQCDVSGILSLRDASGVACNIVSGGREASAMVKDARVRAVVAVACEKELADGILASFPKPVMAVPNLRPCGPCRDTRVDLAAVRIALDNMIAPS